MKNDKKRKSRRIFAVVALLAVFCVMIGAVMYWENYVIPDELHQEMTIRQPEESSSIEPEPIPTITEEPETVTTPAEPLIGEGVIKILLTGQDRREGEGSARSDTMILCTFDTRTNTMTMISFLRDIYLPIPGHSSNRLNTAYAWGGFELLNETMAENFDVEVDGNIDIDFYGFMDMIDYLGGLDIDLTAEEAEYLNENGNWDVTDFVEWDLTEGLNHLNGSQALAYSRIRYLDSDFGRTARQRNVLIALLEQLRNATLHEAINAVDKFLKLSNSNLTDEQLLGYVLELYPMLMECNVVTQQIPADGTYKYSTIQGKAVIEVDFEANREIINELIAEPEDDIEKSNN